MRTLNNFVPARPSFLGKKRVLCAYCHRTHLKTDMPDGVCPQMRPAAAGLQERFAFKCTACDGEGRFERQVEIKLLESTKKYEERWKRWMEEAGCTDPSAQPPARRVFKCEQKTTEVVCDECNGEGKILRMVGGQPDRFSSSHSKLGVNPTWVRYRMQPTPPEGQIHCSICLVDADPAQGNFRMDCGHQFHSNCIFHWLRINDKCPICRHVDPFINLALVPPPQEEEMDGQRLLYQRMMREGIERPVDEDDVIRLRHRQPLSYQANSDIDESMWGEEDY